MAQSVVAEDAVQPRVAIAADGSAYVVMIRQGQIQVAVSRDGGKTFDPPSTAIDAQGKARGGSDRGPRIGIDAKGTPAVRGDGKWVVYPARSDGRDRIYCRTSID